jgi:hypothetical protein
MVTTGMEHRRLAKAQAQQGWLASLLCSVPWLGLVLMVILPLVYRRRFPGKERQLLRSSAISTAAFIGTSYLFSFVLLLLRMIQNKTGGRLDPVITITHGVFTFLEEKADRLGALGRQLIEPTLDQLSNGGEGSAGLVLLQNAQHFRGEISAFRSIAGFYKSISGVVGYVPFLLVMIAVYLFFMSALPVFKDILKIPLYVAEGSADAEKRVVRAALGRVGRELLATLCQIGALLVVTALVGVLLRAIVGPAIRAFMVMLLVSLYYVQRVPNASSALMLFALGATLLYLLLNVVLALVTSSVFLIKTGKIFKDRFHSDVPLRAHARFWKWGIPAVVWTLVLPLIYLNVANQVAGAMATSLNRTTERWGLTMTLIPLMLIVGWGVVFWAARGAKSFVWLARYQRTDVPTTGETAEPQPVALAS